LCSQLEENELNSKNINHKNFIDQEFKKEDDKIEGFSKKSMIG
jgi:hypothetical protein